MSRALVIPTNRPESLAKFFQAWKGKGGWDRCYVVYDSPCITPEIMAAVRVDNWDAQIFSHKEIRDQLGDNSWIISQEDSACRAFGFLKAWQNGDEFVQTLDDDCLPYEPHCNLMDRHIECMTRQNRWQSSIPGYRVRGLPYENLGKCQTVLNYGLWTAYADYDAQTELAGPEKIGQLVQGGFFPTYSGGWVIPFRTLVPLSGMNFCASRAALPLCYFPLQGKGQPYRRFDDIWMGIIAKCICDRIGWRISIGEPYIEHRRASDVKANLEKERPGIEANETIWQVIADAADRVPFTPSDPIYVMQTLAGKLEDSGWGYVNRLGKAIRVWANLFCKI